MTRCPRRWRAALALTLLLALTGCVKLDMDMDVRADNTVDGTLIIAVDKEFIKAAGLTEQQVVSQLDKQGPFRAAERPKHGSFAERPYDSDGKVGKAYTFKDVPLTEFGGGPDGLSIRRQGDRFLVTGVVDMTTSAPADLADPGRAGQFGKSAETRIRMTFPGEVLKANGKIDGRSVTWNPKIGEKTMLTAEARTSAIIPILLTVVGGIVLLLLVVGLIVFLVVRSRRSREPAPAGGYDGGADAGGGQHVPAAYPPPGGYPPSDVTQPLPRVDPPAPGPPPGRPFGT